MFEFGIVTDISQADAGYVKVRKPLTDVVTEFIPVVRPFAKGNTISIPIQINDQVLVGCTGLTGREFVIGMVPSDEDKPYDGAGAKVHGVQYDDGTRIEYNIETSELKVAAVGDVSIETTGSVKVKALAVTVEAATIALKGDVSIVGALSADGGLSLTGGDISISDGDITAGSVSLKAHVHSGVTTGGGVTGTPVV